MSTYDFSKAEKKWQNVWEEQKIGELSQSLVNQILYNLGISYCFWIPSCWAYERFFLC